jgi:phosphoribosylanthranilate isomerase
VTVRVKICGVTLAEDAAATAAAGADMLGLNFWPGSKRRITIEQGVALAAAARGAATGVGLVGVFVDADIRDMVTAVRAVGLDAIQLHGDESAECVAEVATRTGVPVWKAIAVGGAADLDGLARLEPWPVDAVVLDAPSPGRGGSGKTIDWDVARAAVERWSRRVVLAGGLTPDNVAAAVARVQPWAVDVASGVETSPGVKDPERVRAFVRAARAEGLKGP